MAGSTRPNGRRASACAVRMKGLQTASIFVTGIVLSAAMGGLVFFLPALATATSISGQAVAIPSPAAVAARAATPAPSVGGPFTVLLLGSDNDEKFDPNVVLTQSMILVRVDPAAKQVTMLSIPRDLWVPLSAGGTAKIDAAYAYGGAAAAIATVERNFHVHIDEFAWVGLEGLIMLIDWLGGVDVLVNISECDVVSSAYIYG